MPPTTRSSSATSAPAPTVDDISSASTTIVDEASILAPSSIQDSDVLTTVMDSIKATTRAIDVITQRLTAQTASIDHHTKTIAILDDAVKDMGSTIHDFPKIVDVKLETIQETLRSDLSTSLQAFGNKFIQDLSSQRDTTELCFKSHASTISRIMDDVATISQNFVTLQESSLSKEDVARIVVEKWEDELDPHIKSHYDFKTEATTRLDSIDNTLQDTVSALKNYSQLSGTSTSRSSSLRSTGFHQSTTKDFSVSKLQKELKEIKLTGDSLHSFEIFWDSILSAFTNLCQVDQAYPHYRDLSPSFSFENHLVASVKPPRYLPADSAQAKRNYRSFGDALRIFLNSGTSITETTSPQSYLKLLSLSDIHDGFLLLENLIFSLSPQLSGDYHDYRSEIETLNIISGEHISKFYQRVIRLSTEINLSNINNGNKALLAHRFLVLLRSTQCPTITGLLMSYWHSISKHRRDPKHITIELPWHFKNVYDDLVASGITTLSLPTENEPTLIAPSAFAVKSAIHTQSVHSPKHIPSSTTTIGLYKTKDGRKFISHNNNITPARRPSCLLCNNKHTNPWHDTSNCPLKHPTHILPKDVRERVLQHNALHGTEKRGYTKDQDIQTKASTPPQASSAITSLDPIIDTSTTIPQALEPALDTTEPTDHDEIIETEYFDIPVPPAVANLASTSVTDPYQDIDPDLFVTDAIQYLAYDS
jgi:hypothetical protein